MKQILVVIVVALVALFIYSLTTNSLVLTEVDGNKESLINIDVTLTPERPIEGEEVRVDLKFTNKDGTPVGNLMEHHARRVHAVFMSKNLDMIGHVHPSDFNEITDEIIASGEYSVNYTFPKGGDYILGIDVMNMSGAIAKQYIINVEGNPQDKLVKDLSTQKCFKGYPQQGHGRFIDTVSASESEVDCSIGYEVTFKPTVDSIVAGQEVELHYAIKKDGEDVTDLTSFLGEAIHLAIVPTTLSTLLHYHGVAVMEMDMGGEMMETHSHEDSMEDEHEMDHSVAPTSFGPFLASEGITFPEPGTYRIFSQAKHGENIIFMSFMVDVE